MRLDSWLKSSTKKLEEAGISSARLDCLILLEDATGKDRSWLLAHPEHSFQGWTFEKLDKQIERRMKHEPLAYIRGKTEFYGRTFFVNKDVLEPRPESETMIELLKELVSSLESPVTSPKTRDKEIESKYYELKVIDVGTGSGALAITAKLEIPQAEVVATDIDPNCIKVAAKNAKNLDAKITFYQGDLLQPLSALSSQPSAIVLANLPYVPDSHTINLAAANEPRHAIFGGPDGLGLYRRLFSQLSSLNLNADYVLTESLPFQHDDMASIALDHTYSLIKTEDLIQVFALTNA